MTNGRIDVEDHEPAAVPGLGTTTSQATDDEPFGEAGTVP